MHFYLLILLFFIGDYSIAIKFNDEHVPGSPFNVVITGDEMDAKRLSVMPLMTVGVERDLAVLVCFFPVLMFFIA